MYYFSWYNNKLVWLEAQASNSVNPSCKSILMPPIWLTDYLDPFIQNGTEDNMLKAYRSVLKLIPSHPQTENFG